MRDLVHAGLVAGVRRAASVLRLLVLVFLAAHGCRPLPAPELPSALTGLPGWRSGRSALDIPAAAEAMARAVRNIGGPGTAAMAISAVDVALWDLKARLLGLPVTGLLGRALKHVPIYGSAGFTTYDEHQAREQLSGWIDKDRIRLVKIKIGQDWGGDESRDLARVALAREVIGPDTALYVDANGAYSTGQAVRMAHRMADYGVTWFEQPVSSQDLAGLAAVRAQVSADVAAGEYSWSLADSARLLGAGAVDCLQLDVTRCGGISEFLRGSALAAAHKMQVSGHCAPNLHAHVGSAVPNLRHLEYFHDHQRIERMPFDGALDPDGGADARPGQARTRPAAARGGCAAVPEGVSHAYPVPAGEPRAGRLRPR